MIQTACTCGDKAENITNKKSVLVTGLWCCQERVWENLGSLIIYAHTQGAISNLRLATDSPDLQGSCRMETCSFF